ncbi:proline dehydrogenase family protein [Brumimicrobium oceani]|uniref:Proline dehydrogenase n=1 Tax=Brumimicrobium oceani TaxID=2100725 RepID=A0A2U2XEF1_9FLAO|nr:proline dehydrogenase family protein [Brumimicrobium oceani]PWH86182.1 proline dehydrogenase [Brumimicrobium oceani]
MISFDNTEIAFKYKSTKDLKRAYTMFKLVGKSWLVQFGKLMVPIAFKLKLPIQGIIRATIFKQFCGGETIDDCDQTIQTLYDNNVGTILDYSVEGKTEEEDFDATRDEILATIEKAKGNKAIPFAVFKPTGLSRHALLEKLNDEKAEPTVLEKAEFTRVFNRINDICKHAHDSNVPLFIDAEESWYQDALDRIVESMMAKYNKEKCIVYNTFQMYRHDRLDYIKNAIEKAKREGYKFGAKLVRGAYMEKERDRAAEMGYPSPIQPDKNSTDIDFNAATKLMVEEIETCSLCCGTHNEDSSHLLVDLMEEFNIAKDDKRIYFAQLLGMSDHISFNLAYHGYQVAKYVPYGPVKEVMPYLLRRADENTSVAGQTGRELNLISREWKRRKLTK